jgi:hypothetical protein
MLKNSMGLVARIVNKASWTSVLGSMIVGAACTGGISFDEMKEKSENPKQVIEWRDKVRLVDDLNKRLATIQSERNNPIYTPDVRESANELYNSIKVSIQDAQKMRDYLARDSVVMSYRENGRKSYEDSRAVLGLAVLMLGFGTLSYNLSKPGRRFNRHRHSYTSS